MDLPCPSLGFKKHLQSYIDEMTWRFNPLNMDFSEALTRFAKVDPSELPDKFILKKKGAKKAPIK